MHVSIRHYERAAKPVDATRRAGRDLGAILGDAPGFVSYLVFETVSGGLAAVSIFESEAALEGGDHLLSAWEREHLGAPLAFAAHATTGEVVIQRGL